MPGHAEGEPGSPRPPAAQRGLEEAVDSGYAGVYANFVGVPRVGETFVDGFTVKD